MFSNEQATNSNALTPKFEGFFIEMVMPRLDDVCEKIVRKFLGEDWQVKPISDSLTEFEITLNDDALSVKEAWDKTYELRSQPGVIDVEPLFAVPIPELTDWDEVLKQMFLIIELRPKAMMSIGVSNNFEFLKHGSSIFLTPINCPEME